MPTGIYKRTEEARKNMSLAQIGKVALNKGLTKSDPRVAKYSSLGKRWKVRDTSKMRHSAWNKGMKMSEEYGTQVSERQLGKKRGPHSLETRKKISIAHGSKKGWVTPINKLIRTSLEYKDWRTKVFQRDNYTCQECESSGVTLNADHIKPFAYYPELRLVIENGRTLCVPCHRSTDTYAGRGLKREKYTSIKTNHNG